jgi:hypothetical protein
MLWLRKIALVVALTVLPLQSLAVAVSFLLCRDDPQMGMDVMVSDEQGDHECAPRQRSTSDEIRCCSFTAYIPAHASIDVDPSHLSVRISAPDALHDLHFPDLPQRPPLA